MAVVSLKCVPKLGLVALAIFLQCSCGGGSVPIANTGASSVPSNTAAISVSPSTVVLQAGYTLQFTATVGHTTDSAVAWLVNGVQGGNSSLGTISATGLYHAPAVVPSSPVLTVSAQSTQSTAEVANASVTISATPATVTVSISPTSASLQTGQSKQFTATVSGTTNTGVDWYVNGIAGGDSTVGAISAKGLYTAPECASGASVTVTARSAYDSASSATANVGIAQAAPVAGVYYVSTTGSDSNTGTACHPWRTISKAAGSAQAGNTVHVGAGTYDETIVSNHSGTASQRIRFLSDERWGAKIVSAASGSAAAWRNNGSYVTIEGFDITCPSCYFGIWNWGAYVWMNYNHIHNMASSGLNAGAGIDDNNYTGWGNEEIGNVVHHIGIPGNGVHQHGIYHASPGGKVMNNILYHNEAWGVNCWHAATQLIITNNTIFANGAYNASVGSYWGGGISYTNANSGSTGPFDYSVIANNIIFGNGGRALKEWPDGYSVGPHNIVSNNLMFNNAAPASFIQGNLGSRSDVNRVNADPQFINYQPTLTFTAGNYHLKSTSPAINAGTSTDAPSNDFDNGARPVGKFDIGAYEYGAAPGVWPW